MINRLIVSFEFINNILCLQGGLSEGGRPRVLTAYVMAALLEAGESATDKAIPNAVFCLKGCLKQIV